MKQIVLSAFLLTGYTAFSQDLAHRIPKDALAVVAVKGDQLFELLSVKEFNNSLAGKKILKAAGKKGEKQPYNSIEDFGIQLKGTVYYFNQQTDSIGYNCLLVPLSDAGKFEQLFVKEGEEGKIVRNGDQRLLYDEGGDVLFQWNNEMAYLVSGSLKDSYLEEDSIRAERYGIKKVVYRDFYKDDYYHNDPEALAPNDEVETISETIAVPPAEEVYVQVDTAVAEEIMIDSGVADAAAEAADEAQEVMENDYPVVAEPVMVEVESPTESYYDEAAYRAALEKQKGVKKQLTASWLRNYAVARFADRNPSSSILDNPAYQRSQDKNAAASFYLSDMQSLYRGILPYFSTLSFGNIMDGYGSINAKLYLNKENMRITSEMEVDDKKAASYKKMYQHKPNKKFAKYINSDKIVGFMSYAFDTEAYLKELPQLIDQGYGRYFGLYNDEIGIGSELFSLLLDEKAVAKVIKGDALLLLNDIGPKEYAYTTYEYNDDYERTEVKKTKTETLPEFLFMMSSDDTHLLERVLRYGIKKEMITEKNGIYSVDSKVTKGSPFNLHILIKDGIVFCGTSYKDIQQISTNHYVGQVTKEQKNLLLKNNMALYFNPANMVGKISEKEFGNYDKLRDFNTLLGNTGKMYARTTGIKSNRISGEMVAEVPEGKENALKYFFSWIENAARLD